MSTPIRKIFRLKLKDILLKTFKSDETQYTALRYIFGQKL